MIVLPHVTSEAYYGLFASATFIFGQCLLGPLVESSLIRPTFRYLIGQYLVISNSRYILFNADLGKLRIKFKV